MKVIGGREPDEDLIQLLRDLLVDAEEGHLTCLAGIAEYADRSVDDLYAGQADWMAISGRLHRLSIQIAEDEDED